jgi:hypothetical protein
LHNALQCNTTHIANVWPPSPQPKVATAPFSSNIGWDGWVQESWLAAFVSKVTKWFLDHLCMTQVQPCVHAPVQPPPLRLPRGARGSAAIELHVGGYVVWVALVAFFP